MFCVLALASLLCEVNFTHEHQAATRAVLSVAEQNSGVQSTNACLGPGLVVGAPDGDDFTCEAPGPFLPFDDPRCAVSDQDGLRDAWKSAGGIDFNGDGKIDEKNDLVLPGVKLGSKQIYLHYDYMVLPDDGNTCRLEPLPSPLNIYFPYYSPDCAFDQHCISGVCRGHSDEPDKKALKMVVDSFAAHGIKLIIDPHHNAIPHSDVIFKGPTVDACTAQTAALLPVERRAANFYDLKERYFDCKQQQAYHYAIFAHRHSCDSPVDCNQAICTTAGHRPEFNETGESETPGNDLIISMGGFRDRFPLTDMPLIGQAGTFMHELGHNLGLRHGGPSSDGGVITNPITDTDLGYKPNYVSVMNYLFQLQGISSADPGCAAADAVCKTTPVATRLDYSSYFDEMLPNTLDETDGSEATGLNLGHHDISYTFCPISGLQTAIPGTGPVDFNCDELTNETWCANGCTYTAMELNHSATGLNANGLIGGDVLLPHEDWPNLFLDFHQTGAFLDGIPPLLSENELTVETAISKHLLYPIRHIDIEITPGCAEKIISPGRHEEFSLAVLGASDFDVRAVEPSSLSFNGAQALRTEVRDVNRDGKPDLLVFFDQASVRLNPRARTARLTGWLNNSQLFIGQSRITIAD